MRLSSPVLVTALFSAAMLPACTSKPQDETPNPAPSASESSASVEIPNAPPSPFMVVLESPKALVFSGLGAGIAVTNDARTHLATQMGAAEMIMGTMPEGLPSEGKVLRFDGKLPGSLWLSFESPAEGKASPKTPLFRLDTKKKTWKRWTDDWKPLLSPWSSNRVLSMSTSSGKLKIKVVEPHRDKPDADGPSVRIGDETCEKSLRLVGMTTLANGDVFAAGHCKAGGGSRAYVLVHWPIANAHAAPSATASAGPTPIASAVAPIAPASSASAAPNTSAVAEPAPPNPESLDAGIVDGGADGGAEIAPDIGIHGEVLTVPNAPASLEHRDMVAQGEKDVWVLAAERHGAGHLYRFDGTALGAEELPKEMDGAPRAIAAADDGVLWLVSTSEIWKRLAAGTWEKVPPPTGRWPEPAPKWEMVGAWAAKGDVWIAARHSSAKAERHVVLRLRPVKETLTMP